MKKVLYFIFFLSIGTFAFAQAPAFISYQASVRDGAGALLNSASIGVRISIRENGLTGSVLYRENHTVNTNAFGVFELMIGSGTVESGDFSLIGSGLGTRFLEVEVDITGGTNYTSLGATQLISVPFALRADNSDKIATMPVLPSNPSSGDLLTFNGLAWTAASAPSTNPTGAASGGLTGTYPNPSIANQAVGTNNLATAGANAGDIFRFNGTSWERVPENFIRYNDSLETSKNLIAKEFNRVQTGNANLVPIAYGKVNPAGNTYFGATTANISVTKTAVGVYTINISGELYSFTGYMTSTSLEENSSPGFITASSVASTLVIKTYDVTGNAADLGFSFLVYKK